MNIDGAADEAEEIEEVDEVAQAKAAAKALGRSSRVVDDVTDGLRELNMGAYDDEEDGTCLSCAYPSSVVADICAVVKLVLLSGLEIFSTGIGDLYYPSNDMDPYLKKNDVITLHCPLPPFLCVLSSIDEKQMDSY
jgi:periodic tryptophan protein 1